MASFLRSTLTTRAVRSFSTTPRLCDRAVVYSQNGDPETVLSVLTYPNLPTPPPPNSVNIRLLLAPINPADINVVQGVYPSKPTKTDALAPSGKGSEDEAVFVGGNEGLAEVTSVGQGVQTIREGDWVILTKQQAGTWATDRNVSTVDVLRVPDGKAIGPVRAATLTVGIIASHRLLRVLILL